MTPSDDVEPEIDDLHRWYTAHAEIEENGNMELGESGFLRPLFHPETKILSAQCLRGSIVPT